MSEYQYYEFLAVDRPLTPRQMDEVRAISSRAEISSTSFVNEYQWGDFKGDPARFIELYYDLFLYYANWGTHTFMLGLPADAIELAVLEMYLGTESAWFSIKKEKILIGWDFRDDGGGGWDDGEGEASMGSLAPIREELLRGDHRSLYLGWLLGVQSGEIDDDEEEPPVPPGLKSLSSAQTALAEFMHLDNDLLDFAARASEPFKPVADDVEKIVAALSPEERDELLTKFIRGDEPNLAAKIRRKYMPRSQTAITPTGRTAGQLRSQGETLAAEREAEETRRKAARKVIREAEAAQQRANYLDTLAAKGNAPWNTIEEFVSRKNAPAYDEAIKLLKDLRDVSNRNATAEAFQRKVRDIIARHAKKSSFVQRAEKHKLI